MKLYCYYLFVLLPLLLLSTPVLAGDGCKAMFKRIEQTPQDSLTPKYYRKLMLEFTKDGDGQCAPVLQRLIGFYFSDRGQLDSAISAQAQCAKMYQAINEPIGLASAYGNIARIYARLNQHELALKYEQEELTIYLAQNYTLGIVTGYSALSEEYYQLDYLDSAITYAKQTIELKLRYKSYDQLSKNYGLLASCFYEKNDFKKVRYYLKMAEEALATETDEERLIGAYMRIGEIYGNLEDFDKCFYWLRKSLDLGKKMDKQVRIQDVYDDMANFFTDAKQLDSAMHYMTLLNELKENINSENFQAAIAKEAIKADNQKREFELQEAKLKKERSQLMTVIVIIIALIAVLTVLIILRYSIIKRKTQAKEQALETANAMIRGQDKERARVATELHDRVGSMISTAKNQLTVTLENAKLQQPENAIEVMRLLDQTNDEVRMISHNLSDGAIIKQGLDNALRNICASNSALGKHRVNYVSTGQTIPLDIDKQMDLYRITQELLNNAAKYANAREVSIQVSLSEDNIVYSYEDDGQGFDKAKLIEKPGIGYQNLETRVKRMNASWHLDTSPGNGTNVIIEIPVV